MRWAEQTDLAYYINLFITDVVMRILYKYRNNERLTNQDINIMRQVNASIYSAPRTITPFSVVSGVFVDPNNPFRIGQVFEYGISRSATINAHEAIAGYLSDDDNLSVLLLIHIPRGAILTYHPSENQVIFPIGAKFCITSEQETINIQTPDGIDTIPIYRCLYIDAPNNPETIPRASSITYTNSNKVSTINSMYEQEYIFPYRPPTFCSLEYNNKIIWTMHLYTYSADLIAGILFATENINIDGVRFICEERIHLVSSSNSYHIIASNIKRCSKAVEYLRGFLTIYNAFHLDYQSVITDIVDEKGVHYRII